MNLDPKQLKPGAEGQFLGIVNGQAQFTPLPTGVTRASYQMAVGGKLRVLQNAGSEIISTATTLTNFRGRRISAGSSGSTTVQLELNGSAVAGAELTWNSSDPDGTLKTLTISQAVAAGDRLSIRITAAETNAVDVFTEAD